MWMSEEMKSMARSTLMLIAVAFALVSAANPAAAQAASSAQAPLALMPLPSSITRGEGAFTVTPAGGGPSTFTYNYGQTHDARLEAAVRRSVIRLGRTCGGEVLRSTIDHPAPSTASLLINVAAPGEPVQTIDEDESYQLSVTAQGSHADCGHGSGRDAWARDPLATRYHGAGRVRVAGGGLSTMCRVSAGAASCSM